MPHQVTFLAWAIEMGQQYRGGICADGMGMGKTHQIISFIIIMQCYKKIKKRTDGKTLIVPGVLMGEWNKDLPENLHRLPGGDHHWQVYSVERGHSRYQPGMKETRPGRYARA